MSSLEILLISLLYEMTEKQIAGTAIPTAPLFSFSSNKWGASFSFICQTPSKATWPCLLALKYMQRVVSFPKQSTPN